MNACLCHFPAQTVVLSIILGARAYLELFAHTMAARPELTCGISGCEEQVDNVDEKIRAHLLDQHPNHTKAGLGCVFEISTGPYLLTHTQSSKPDIQTPPDLADVFMERGRSSSDLVDPTIQEPHKARSNSHRSRRLKAVPRAAAPVAHDSPFRRRPQVTTEVPGQLWSPGDLTQSTLSAGKLNLVSKTRRGEPQARWPPHATVPMEEESPVKLIKQPKTYPINNDKLINEVKAIYAGLVMVESKCIQVDNAQSSRNETETKLNNEQWQALIALHRTLLHEHHDFFLASQHPSASPAVRRLASKYAMPARMWRHGIHSFLELLRFRLPDSREHMITYIYLAYSMVALLYETVPAFKDIWIECLGDIGRYRFVPSIGLGQLNINNNIEQNGYRRRRYSG